MKIFNKIIITFRRDRSASCDKVEYDRSEWDDYNYDGKFFIVIKDGTWIGFFNLDTIEMIEIE